MFNEYDRVAITENMPDDGVVRGDVGVVVHCYPGKSAYEVEVYDEDGGLRAHVVTVREGQLLRLNLKSLVP